MASNNLFTGFVLGVAATLVAREVMKKLPENGTPLTRGLGRAALTIGEKFQETAAEIGEVVEEHGGGASGGGGGEPSPAGFGGHRSGSGDHAQVTAAPVEAPSSRDSDPVARLTNALLRGETEALESYLSLLHPAVVADAIEALPRRNRQTLWEQASPAVRGELLLEVNRSVRRQLIDSSTPDELVAAAIDLEPDEQADLAEDLPTEVLNRLLPRLDEAGRDAFQLVSEYPHDSAGGLMDVDHIAVRARALRLRRAPIPPPPSV